jgi:hypothetical protein
MKLRFHVDSSGELHIWKHNIRESEVADAMVDPLESIRGRGDSIISIGVTRAGRYVKVIYSPDKLGDGIFVITAFEVPPKQVRGLKRRLKRRRQ